MASFGPESITWSFVANSDLSTAQFKLVKLTADNTVDLCSGVTDKPIGVLQNAPTSGQEAQVLISGITKVMAAAALSAGTQFATNASALAAAAVAGTDTTKYIIGTVLEANSAANGLVTAAVDCAAPNRGA